MSPAEPAAEVRAPQGRLPGIDMLRGVAAAAVALAHVVQPTLPRFFDRWATDLTALGAWGVGIFFVVSGFCIHAPTVRRELSGHPARLDYREFYRRRFVRLYPAHLIALFLSIGVAALVPFPADLRTLISVVTPSQLCAHLLMVHTFIPSAIYSGNGVLWTLALETHFYLAYPLFLALRRRWGSGRVLAGLFVFSAALTLASRWMPASLQLVYTSALYRWWEWVMGCVVVERVLTRAPSFRVGTGAAMAIALATLAVGVALPHVHGGGLVRTLTWPFFFAIAVLTVAWMRAPAAGLAPAALLAVGHASYSLYLVHPIAYHVAVAALVALGAGPAALVTGSLVVLAVFTTGFYRGVERPFMRRALTPALPAAPVLEG